MRQPPLSNCPLMICAGANEPEGWIDQSMRYSKLCESKGIKTKFELVDDAHHFSLLILLLIELIHFLFRSFVLLRVEAH